MGRKNRSGGGSNNAPASPGGKGRRGGHSSVSSSPRLTPKSGGGKGGNDGKKGGGRPPPPPPPNLDLPSFAPGSPTQNRRRVPDAPSPAFIVIFAVLTAAAVTMGAVVFRNGNYSTFGQTAMNKAKAEAEAAEASQSTLSTAKSGGLGSDGAAMATDGDRIGGGGGSALAPPSGVGGGGGVLDDLFPAHRTTAPDAGISGLNVVDGPDVVIEVGAVRPAAATATRSLANGAAADDGPGPTNPTSGLVKDLLADPGPQGSGDSLSDRIFRAADIIGLETEGKYTSDLLAELAAMEENGSLREREGEIRRAWREATGHPDGGESGGNGDSGGPDGAGIPGGWSSSTGNAAWADDDGGGTGDGTRDGGAGGHAGSAIPLPDLTNRHPPSLCPDGKTYGYSDWTALRKAVQEANRISAEAFLHMSSGGAPPPTRGLPPSAAPGPRVDPPPGSPSTDDADAATEADEEWEEDDEEYPPIPDPFVICPSATLRTPRRRRSQPIYVNAEDVLIECDNCVIDAGGTHLAFGPHGKGALVRGVTFTGATTSSLTFHHHGSEAVFEDCYWAGNRGGGTSGAVADLNSTSSVSFYRCEISDNQQAPRVGLGNPGGGGMLPGQGGGGGHPQHGGGGFHGGGGGHQGHHGGGGQMGPVTSSLTIRN